MGDTATIQTKAERWRPLGAPRCFLVLSLVGGIAITFVTPPFQVPDEPAHLYRSYAVSEGMLGVRTTPQGTGAILPASLRELVALASGVAAQPEQRFELDRFRRGRRLRLDPERREFLAFPGAAVTSPLPYLPQAAAIAAGRLLGAGPLALLYLGRLAVVVVTSAMIWLAIVLLPGARWTTALIALTPMAVFLRGSLSADSLTFALAILTVALTARLAFAPGPPAGFLDLALVTCVAVSLCLTKPVYAPLATLPLVIPRARRGRPLALAWGAGHVALVVGGLAAASVFALSAMEPVRPGAGVDPTAQLRQLLADPLEGVTVIGRDLLVHAPRYAAEMIGRLGWLDTPLPTVLLAVYAAALAVLAAVDVAPSIEVHTGQRFVVLLVVAATVLLIEISLYLLWTPVGAAAIEGVQGRYFLPVAAAAVWLMPWRRLAAAFDPRMVGALAALVAGLSLAVAMVAVVERYYW